MKKWMARIWMRRLRYSWSRKYRAKHKSEYSDTQLPRVNNLSDVCEAMRQINYFPDKFKQLFDVVEDAEQVWKTKKADCDGFAVLAVRLTKTLRSGGNMLPVLLTVVLNDIEKSHTVCVFWYRGGLYHISNWYSCKPVRVPENNYSGVAQDLADRAGSSLICWDVVNEDGLEVLEYHE